VRGGLPHREHESRKLHPALGDPEHAVLRAEETSTPERGLAAIPPEAVLERCIPFLV
jgi:hypothetical protein